MSITPSLRQVLWTLVAAWALGSTGCIHNHYYGTSAVPGCPPGTQPVTTQVGSVCEVQPGTTIVSQGSGTRTTSSNVNPAPASSDRVVISQPGYSYSTIGGMNSRFRSPWRRVEPEATPTIKAEGAYDDTTIR